MKKIILAGLLLVALAGNTFAQKIEVFAKFNKNRPANPAVDRHGNVYVTMHPLDGANVSLMKIDKNGNRSVYPNKTWASNPNGLGEGIANAIGIQVTKNDLLYVLDWGNKTSEPRVVVWDIAKNQLHRLYIIPAYVRKANSFLQDFALDTKRGFIYIADMGRANLVGEQTPAIIALDLKTGYARRLLEKNPTFMASETGFKADGKNVTLQTDKGKVALNLGLNPITIDPKNEWVYYSTVNAGKIYRIKASTLSDFSKTNKELSKAIETYGPKPATDGISIDGEGNVYITSLSEDAIGITTKGKYEVYIQDKRLSWVDGMSYGPDGYFYAVVDQLHKSAALNGGKELATKPYLIVKFKSKGKNKIGR
ncbi:hypothetical protein BKI52_01840 [marine bacterium AO1-C]|nr:hypothetical protein BKI52_01840 [marine bacterium AO1-C]